MNNQKSKAQKIVNEYKEKFEKIDCEDFLDTDRLCDDCAHLKTKAETCKENWEDELKFLSTYYNKCKNKSLLIEQRLGYLRDELKILEEQKSN